MLKTRLTLENFTGLGVEAVKQDFYATLHLSGLESVLTGLAQEILDSKETRYPQKVNRAVSFNAIKTQAFALLMNGMASDRMDRMPEKLTALFFTKSLPETKKEESPVKKHPLPFC